MAVLFIASIFSAVSITEILHTPEVRPIVQKIPPFLPTGQRRIGILLGLLSASTITLLFTAFAYLPAAVAISCYYAYPMLTILWCCIFWKRPLERGQLTSLLLCVIGIILLSLDGIASGLSVRGGVCAFGSAVTMSIQIMLMERHMSSVHKVRYNFTAFCIALAIFSRLCCSLRELGRSAAFSQMDCSIW